MHFDLAKLASETKILNRKEELAQVFQYETENFMLENIPSSYLPEELAEANYSSVLNGDKAFWDDGGIKSFFHIPSSLSLANFETYNPVDISLFRKKQRELRKARKITVEEDFTAMSVEDAYPEQPLK